MFFFSRRKVSAIYIYIYNHMRTAYAAAGMVCEGCCWSGGPYGYVSGHRLTHILGTRRDAVLSGGIRAAAKRVLGESTGDSERKIRNDARSACPLVLTDSRTKDGVLDPLG